MSSPSHLRPPVFGVLLGLALALAPCARPARAQAADDRAVLSAITDRFFSAFGRKDMGELLELWSASAPGLAAFAAEAPRAFAAVGGIELKGVRVRAVAVEGARASVRVTVELYAADAQTGKAAPGFGRVNRTLRFVKDDGGWKVWQYAASEEELASALVAAKTEQERRGLLGELRELDAGEVLEALLRQGDAIRRHGDYPLAFSVFQLAQEIAQQTNNRLAVARALNSTGNIHRLQGNYARAMEYYQRSLAASEEAGEKLWIAGALTNIGNVHGLQGNYAQAHEYFQRGRALSEELGNKLWIAGALNNIGLLHQLQGDYAQALRYFRECLALSRELGDKGLISSSLTNLGTIQGAQGHYAEALEYHRKSLALSEESDDKTEIARTLIRIGDIHRLRGEHPDALAAVERATAVASRLASSELLWNARNLTGRIHRALGNRGEALRAFAAAIEGVEEMRQMVAGGEQARQRFFENKLAPYHGAIELLVGDGRPGEAFAYAERAKARLLLDVLIHGRAGVAKTLPPQEQAQERALNDELTELNARLFAEGQRARPDAALVADLKARREKARLAYESFQTNLHAAHPQLRVQRGQAPPTLRPADVAAVLPDDQTALLEFVVAEQDSYLFVLTRPAGADPAAPVRIKVYPLAVTAGQIAARVGGFRQMLADRNLEYQGTARQLYDLLIKPAEEELRGKKTICIVPDGMLWDLPFQAVQPRPGVHLIEDYALFYAPSLSVLRETAKRGAALEPDGRRPEAARGKTGRGAAPPSAPTLLAFGNPRLDRGTVARVNAVYRDEHLGPLPRAEQEVRMLGRLYGPTNSKVLVGAAARESTLKAEAGTYRVLHFATHGVFDDNNPMYSHVTLSQAEGDAREDGLLEAREIIDMDFNAELAVLSACQTARGRVGAGEGMIGMSWALFVAGIPTTVASQWKVDSDSTTALMIEFHRRLTAPPSRGGARMKKAEALRQAALAVMRRGRWNRHPFFWGAFVMVGNGW